MSVLVTNNSSTPLKAESLYVTCRIRPIQIIHIISTLGTFYWAKYISLNNHNNCHCLNIFIFSFLQSPTATLANFVAAPRKVSSRQKALVVQKVDLGVTETLAASATRVRMGNTIGSRDYYICVLIILILPKESRFYGIHEFVKSSNHRIHIILAIA